MPDFEKLGVFYVGRPYDLGQKKSQDGLTLYKSKDLVTHAVCVGMTGSGKTGLCTCLLEEAAIDGIPSIVIDPKGDMTNLLLTFPGLTAAEFRPWINEDDATTKGMSPDDYAKAQADMWKTGLAGWGEDGARIQRLKDSAEFTIYTPGSGAGMPVSILKSFAAPPANVLDDSELLAEQIGTATTGLLTLLGIDADPVRSREHILISNILASNWQAGRDLDLAGLINQIQQPPVQRIGVLDLESFYPSNQRFELAMRLNNLLAAPGFNMWLQGDALDAGKFLYTATGKPRVSVFYIAHLDDAERMFFVSLLLGQVISWMRGQSGTTSLRAILYMDEIFGYFPPTANPPSKQPLLTLMKQARAFGLGVVLATQNPVDLDYKGLSNAGTWLLGRLQTERDKLRVLDGLEGVTASSGGNFDRRNMDNIISSLGKRIFVLHNVNEDAPQIFETRWALSYLRGPLMRDQIRTLMAPVKARLGSASMPGTTTPGAAAQPADARTAVPSAAMPGAGSAGAARPILPPGIAQYFIPLPGKAGGAAAYIPMVYAAAQMYFADARLGVNESKDVAFLAPLQDGAVPVDWDRAEATDIAADALATDPVANAGFASLPAAAARPQSYATWRADFSKWLYRSQSIELLRSPSLGAVSKPGESERDFRVRLQQLARERRDSTADKINQKYAARVQSLQNRVRVAESAVDREKAQANQQKMQTALSVGATLFSVFFGSGKRGTIGRATTAARGVGRSMKDSGDVGRAQENADALQKQLDDLQAQAEEEIKANDPVQVVLSEQFDKIVVKPKPTGVSVQVLSLAWVPS